jgi:hypothetical protein
MYQFYYGFVKRCRAPRLDSGTNRVLYIQLPLNAIHFHNDTIYLAYNRFHLLSTIFCALLLKQHPDGLDCIYTKLNFILKSPSAGFLLTA